MKRELFMAVRLESPGGGPLAEVARVMGTLPVVPDDFIWSAVPGTDEARIWIIVELDDARFEALVADLGAVPVLSRISTSGPGQSIMEKLLLGRSS